MRKLNFSKAIDTADIPTITIIGFALGFLLIGIGYLTFGQFNNFRDEVLDGNIWDVSSILSGLLCLGIAIAVIGIAALYWWLVPRKHGAIFPLLNGFGVFPALIAMFSALFIAFEII